MSNERAAMVAAVALTLTTTFTLTAAWFSIADLWPAEAFALALGLAVCTCGAELTRRVLRRMDDLRAELEIQNDTTLIRMSRNGRKGNVHYLDRREDGA
ncbi:hypothetical protein [Amycolatopsis sp. CA-230715]|uniref:hypothetical protein n=1 Tax=Amycolatopsis sp. CA-230715 TaxID=2745196 RepID=UPI001C032536|nr:hypothetical protein [Amycolatopsis sp. CA-230715]QWF81164.1 hypothetical protein HUW46_04590 [Amycolatopsis sp. CA-230715]